MVAMLVASVAMAATVTQAAEKKSKATQKPEFQVRLAKSGNFLINNKEFTSEEVAEGLIPDPGSDPHFFDNIRSGCAFFRGEAELGAFWDATGTANSPAAPRGNDGLNIVLGCREMQDVLAEAQSTETNSLRRGYGVKSTSSLNNGCLAMFESLSNADVDTVQMLFAAVLETETAVYGKPATSGLMVRRAAMLLRENEPLSPYVPFYGMAQAGQRGVKKSPLHELVAASMMAGAPGVLRSLKKETALVNETRAFCGGVLPPLVGETVASNQKKKAKTH